MTLADLKAFIRFMIDDKEIPYRMDDTVMETLIADAEREAAERSLYFGLDESFNISVVAGTSVYDISQSIIFLSRAKLQGEPLPLIKTTVREIDYNFKSWEVDAGIPRYYWLFNHKLRLYPTPEASYTLLLDGFRRPLSSMETPDQLHRALSHWVMKFYYGAEDTDQYNPVKSAAEDKEFSKIFGHKRSAQFDELWNNNSESSSLYKTPFQMARNPGFW